MPRFLAQAVHALAFYKSAKHLIVLKCRNNIACLFYE